MIEAAALVGGVVLSMFLGVALHDVLRRPSFRRLAVRNLLRRRTEAVLVVLGSSLGTAVIASAFVVGATFHASVRDGARTQLGPIDEQVTLAQVNDLARAEQLLRAPPLRNVDGVLPTLRLDAAGSNLSGSLVKPTISIGGLDLVRAAHFGGHPADTGLSSVVTQLRRGEVIVGTRLARALQVTKRDQMVVHVWGQAHTLVVRAVVDPIGLAGATDLIVSKSTISQWWYAAGSPPRGAPTAMILVSNTGRVFDSAQHSDAVAREIASRLTPALAHEVSSVKADLLKHAVERGSSLGQLFTGIGTFSVLAGVLLLINLFVMLAEERKKELGLARAVGLQRFDLVRILTLEGAFFGVAAAFVGAFVGAGLAWIVARRAAGLVGHDDVGFHLRFVAPTSVLTISALIGLGISLVTVWITSLRVASLNIVQALRDMPEAPRTHHEWSSSLLGAVGILAGVLLTLWGLVSVVPLAAVLGPPLALCSSLPLLRPIVGRRVSTALASAATLVWCIGVFTFLKRITERTSVPVFVVQGVVMVAAAVALATALDRAWSVGVTFLSRTGKGVAARIGLAYPLEKTFRTGLLVGMYALIVFTLTFLVIYAQITTNQTSSITQRVSGGADLLVDANGSATVTNAQLDAMPGVQRVATIWRAGPSFRTATHPGATQWAMSGFDESLLAVGVPHLAERAPGMGTDRAVFATLLAHPRDVVVDDHFLDESGLTAPHAGAAGIGSFINAHDPISGKSARFRVVGITSEDIVGAGVWASAASVRSLSGVGAVPSRFTLRLEPGVNPDLVVDQIERRYGTSGVVATTFGGKVADAMAVEVGFLDLMRRYLSIGLVVGIFGMAVVMVRASRSRRRQIGMLRTIGFSDDVVRRVFLVEAAFIAFQGIATGIGLGLVVSYQMLSRTASLGGEALPFAVPWPTIGALAAIPFVASLAVALIPASQASNIEPAQVLRIPD